MNDSYWSLSNLANTGAMLDEQARVKPCLEGATPTELFVCRTCRPVVKPKITLTEPLKRMNCVACGLPDVNMYMYVWFSN